MAGSPSEAEFWILIFRRGYSQSLDSESSDNYVKATHKESKMACNCMGKGGIRVCGGDITELKPHLPQRSINTVKTDRVQNSSRSR